MVYTISATISTFQKMQSNLSKRWIQALNKAHSQSCLSLKFSKNEAVDWVLKFWVCVWFLPGRWQSTAWDIRSLGHESVHTNLSGQRECLWLQTTHWVAMKTTLTFQERRLGSLRALHKHEDLSSIHRIHKMSSLVGSLRWGGGDRRSLWMISLSDSVSSKPVRDPVSKTSGWHLRGLQPQAQAPRCECTHIHTCTHTRAMHARTPAMSWCHWGL